VSGQCALKFLKPMDVDFLTDGRRRLEKFTRLMRRLDLAAHEKGLLHQEMSDLHCRKGLASRAHKVACLSQNHA
jgi:hypothetical protein